MFAKDKNDDGEWMNFTYVEPEELQKMTEEERQTYMYKRDMYEIGMGLKNNSDNAKKANEKPDDHDPLTPLTPEESVRKTAEEAEKKAKAAERMAQMQNKANREARQILDPLGKADNEKLESFKIIGKSAEVLSTLTSLESQAKSAMEKLKKRQEEKEDPNYLRWYEEELTINIGKINALKQDVEKKAANINALAPADWEQGKMHPREFLRRYKAYLESLNEDDKVKSGRKNLTPEEEAADQKERDDRKAARTVLYKNAEQAVEQSLAQGDFVDNSTTPEEETHNWNLRSDQEKKVIIQKVNKAAGMDIIMSVAREDIGDLHKKLTDGKFDENLEKGIRTMLDQQLGMELTEEEMNIIRERNDAGESIADLQKQYVFSNILRHPIKTLRFITHTANNAAHIEWITVAELGMAFKKLFENIEEAKKQRRIGRVTRTARALGVVASLIPGLGGEQLRTIQDEQNERENREVVDSYKKELGDTRKDYGFTDLFGKHGEGGLLKMYSDIGDTNRTRSILEFAAGKGLLYGMEDSTHETYILPGGVRFRDAMPPDWDDAAVENTYGNLVYANTQGKEASKDAGVKSVTGRNKVSEFVDAFQSAIKGANLWFARGVLEAALVKVKDGEMSAMLTLTVLEEWETNELFRKYSSIKDDWFDRLPGDNKQLLVGMLKYDRAHLIAGAKLGEHNPALATNGKAKPRLGPLVVAVREHLKAKDPSLAKSDTESKAKLKLYTAKVLASQTVELDNKKVVTIYHPDLRRYHIKYSADEMRDVSLEKIGVDNFIERSEIIRGTVEVIKAIAFVSQSGFQDVVKARYMFSHMSDVYKELTTNAKKIAVSDPQGSAELMRAAEQYRDDMQEKLNQWVETLSGTGGNKVLSELHKSQQIDPEPRYLVMELVQRELISFDKIEELYRGGSSDVMRKLLQQLVKSAETPPEMRERARNLLQGSGRMAA